jgi:hypothetical protein
LISAIAEPQGHLRKQHNIMGAQIGTKDAKEGKQTKEARPPSY